MYWIRILYFIIVPLSNHWRFYFIIKTTRNICILALTKSNENWPKLARGLEPRQIIHDYMDGLCTIPIITQQLFAHTNQAYKWLCAHFPAAGAVMSKGNIRPADYIDHPKIYHSYSNGIYDISKLVLCFIRRMVMYLVAGKTPSAIFYPRMLHI